MENPINQANMAATLAEDLTAEGKYKEAIEAHLDAADKYRQAINERTDPTAARTIKKLADSNQKKASDLSMRLRLRDRKSSVSSTSSVESQKSDSLQGGGGSKPESPGSPSQSPRPPPGAAKEDRRRSRLSEADGGPPPTDPITEEHEGSSELDEVETSVSFHRFWEAVEKLVQKLPAGMAYALAHNPSAAAQYYSQEPSSPQKRGNSSMLDSFFMVPADEEEADKRKIEELTKEVALLREQLAVCKKEQGVQELVKENELLRSSIITFKNEVESQAKKYHFQQMRSSQFSPNSLKESSFKESLLRTNSSPSPRSSYDDLVGRVKALEVENAALRTDNAKLVEKVAKYKESWRNLRESAKKRMAATGGGTGTSSNPNLSTLSLESNLDVPSPNSSVFFSTNG